MSYFPFAIFLVFFLIFGGITIAIYVLNSLGLYKLAKNRCFEYAWLAWIPIGMSYIMAKLSRLSPYIKRKFPNIHVYYPIILGAYVLLAFVPYILISSNSLMIGEYTGSFFVSFIVIYIVFMLAAIFISVCEIFILYHIFKIYDPSNAILFTILSVFGLSFIFIFIIRNKIPQYTMEDCSESLSNEDNVS